jgi:hypothetical protein
MTNNFSILVTFNNPMKPCFFVNKKYPVTNQTNTFSIPITFNIPIKTCFSIRNIFVAIQTRPTQIVHSIFFNEKKDFNKIKLVTYHFWYSFDVY